MNTLDYRGVVLAGVHSWGADPLDSVTCRPLWPVLGQSLIQYGVNWLANHGVEDIVICANSNTRRVRAELGHGTPDYRLSYYEDHLPRGPAGCIRDAASPNDRLIVAVEGTSVPLFSLNELLEHHRKTKAALTIAATTVPTKSRRRVSFRPAGVYVFSPQVLDGINAAGYHDIKEGIIPRIRSSGDRVCMFPVGENDALHVRDSQSYITTNRYLLMQALAQSASRLDYIPHGAGFVHQSAQVDKSAKLIGPLLLCPRVRIEADAIVLGPCFIGEDSFVASHSVVKDSILWNNVRVGDRALIDGCVLTDKCVVQAGASSRNRVLKPAHPRSSVWAQIGNTLRLLWGCMSAQIPKASAQGF